MRFKKLTACVLAGAMALSVALTGCGGSTVDANAVGATLNGEDISLGLMNFMARYQQAISDASYLMYFGTEMWSQEISEGVTMEDSTKESVVTSIQTAYLLEDHMADYGVEITAEETAAMEAAAKQFMTDNSKKAITQLGATEEYVKEMLRLYTIEQKVYTAILAASKATVTDEEAAQRTFSYVKVSSTSTTDANGNSVEYTEEEKAELATKMADFATEAAKDFEGAAKTAGYTVSTYSYGANESSMDEKIIAAADALKEGEVSELITTDSDYYIIRLDSEYDKEKTAEKKESLLAEKKEEEYNTICAGYREESEFAVNEANWATVKFDRLFSVATTTEETEE